MGEATYHIGDVFEIMATLPDASVDLVLTSPPFLALRSYLPADHPDKHLEIGSEPNPAVFIDTLLRLTAEWDRLLTPHGSICIELGDTYSGTDGQDWPLDKSLALVPELYRVALAYGINPLTGTESPAGRWRVRNVVRWHRPNPPVGALGDKYRPATTDLVIACKAKDRWFDLDAVRTEAKVQMGRAVSGNNEKGSDDASFRFSERVDSNPAGAPPLDTWTIPTAPFKGAHYATWPPQLCVVPIESMCPRHVCRTCGTPRRRTTENPDALGFDVGSDTPDGDNNAQPRRSKTSNEYMRRTGLTHTVNRTVGWSDCGHNNYRPGRVLDPFAGTGTTLSVATGHSRDAIGIDLDPRNAHLAAERCGMFLTVTPNR